MAYYHSKFCDYCKMDRQHLNNVCEKCRDRLFREKVAIWNSKTDSEKIEELLNRIEKLERKDIRYS